MLQAENSHLFHLYIREEHYGLIALTTAQIIAIVIFVVVMALIISEKVHRTTAALAGAVALILSGVLTFDNGVEPVSYTHLDVYKRQVHACEGCAFIGIGSNNTQIEFRMSQHDAHQLCSCISGCAYDTDLQHFAEPSFDLIAQRGYPREFF